MPRLTQRLVDLHEEGRYDKTDRRRPSALPPSMEGLVYVRRALNRSVGKGWNNTVSWLHQELTLGDRHRKLRNSASRLGYSVMDLIRFHVFTGVIYNGKVPCIVGWRRQIVPLKSCAYRRGFYVDHSGILRRQPKFEYDPSVWPTQSKS